MAEEMAAMLAEFENLKKIHFVLRTEHKDLIAENARLMPEVEKLKAEVADLQLVKDENLLLKSKMSQYASHVYDLEKRNNDLSKVVDAFSKPKAVVEALVNSQVHREDHAGLGYESRASEQARCSTSGVKKESLPSKESVLSAASAQKGKHAAIPYVYKEKFKGKGKAKMNSENHSTNPKWVPLVSKVQPHKPADKSAAKRKVAEVLKNSVKFVRANLAEQPPVALTEQQTLKDSVPKTSCVRCHLCSSDNHHVHQCLLRYTPNAKSQKLKVEQVWVPKRN